MEKQLEMDGRSAKKQQMNGNSTNQTNYVLDILLYLNLMLIKTTKDTLFPNLSRLIYFNFSCAMYNTTQSYSYIHCTMRAALTFNISDNIKGIIVSLFIFLFKVIKRKACSSNLFPTEVI
jgi:hypothetical protein